jgi:hypothetical protein
VRVGNEDAAIERSSARDDWGVHAC